MAARRAAERKPGEGVPGGSSASAATYLASWLSRYPFPQGWVDEAANAACRASEAHWLATVPGDGRPKKEQLVRLVRWKFGWPAARRKPMAGVQDDWRRTRSRIASALRVAAARPDDDETPMEMLCDVKGFGVPMGSAVLAAWFPERFPVVDSRGLRTLRNVRRSWLPTTQRDLPAGSFVYIEHWEPYLGACRALLAQCRASGVPAPGQDEWSLRAVDQALWAANGASGPWTG